MNEQEKKINAEEKNLLFTNIYLLLLTIYGGK